MAAHLYWSQSRFTEIFRCPFLHFQSWAEFLFIRDDDLHVINEEELGNLVVDWFAQSVAMEEFANEEFGTETIPLQQGFPESDCV